MKDMRSGLQKAGDRIREHAGMPPRTEPITAQMLRAGEAALNDFMRQHTLVSLDQAAELHALCPGFEHIVRAFV